MRFDLRLHQSKLAQRLLAVFLLCVLVPVVGLSAVSYVQVRNQLVEQSEARLDRDSRAVVMSILERLILADGMLSTLSPGSVDEHLARRADDTPKPLATAIWTDVDGTPVRTYGSWPLVPSPTPDEAQRLTRGSTLRVHAQNEKVVLARAVEEGLLWASVDTTFLWGSVNDFASLRGDGVACVLGPDRRPVRCDPRLPTTVLADYVGSREPFTVNVDGLPYRAVNREVYFDWHFGTEPWSVILAEPVSAATAPLLGFQRVFIPVALLSIFTVLFFSSLQLRRIFARLLRLQTATAHVAQGVFERDVEVDGDDEIADLAGSFNQMSRQLGRQFALLRATGAIDRAALETQTLSDLSAKVIDALGETFHDCTRVVFMGLKDPHDSRMDGSLAVARPQVSGHQQAVTLTGNQSAQIARLTVMSSASAEELAQLVGQPELSKRLGTAQFGLAPIRLEGETLGFVGVGETNSCSDRRDQVTQLTHQVAVALSNVKRLDELERLNWGALTALARTVDAASEWTAGHSERVAQYAERLGRRLGLGEVELERLRRGGLLHDIGKLGVPAEILEKDGKLTDAEFAKVQEHTVIGAQILEPIVSFADIIPLVLYHHERIDGAGYPMRVSGTAIPYGARIMAVADTFDALTSDRPYRKGMELEKALGILEEVCGTQLDAEMVDEFVLMMREEASRRSGPFEHSTRTMELVP